MLIETICFSGGEFQNLSYHQHRMDKARRELWQLEPIDLQEILDSHRSKIPHSEYVRCRILYAQEIEKVEFFEYHFKPIKRLALIEVKDYEYSYKWSNRRFLNDLLSKYSDFDEVLMTKNSFLTDSTTANIVLFDGSEWHTPSTPLLEGTKRQKLIAEGIIKERLIHTNDLQKYHKILLINAFRNFDFTMALNIEAIHLV
jgi:4-amino-4-deoxychorismate lyase